MLKEELYNHLTQKILPFWERLIDKEHGGYFGFVSRDLSVCKDADKGCILTSRILWTFSTASRILKRPDLLCYADHAYAFLSQAFEDRKNGGVYWSVSYDGRPADTTKHTYCQAFAIYGLAAYFRATGNKQALEKAMALFSVIEDKCTVYNGYGEAYKIDFLPESNEKLSENGVMATRTMNTLMHVLEAYAELYRACGSESVRNAGVKCLERFLHTVYSPDKKRLEVFFDDEYHSLLDMQSYGHDIEASWLLWDAVKTLLPENREAPYAELCITLANSVRERAFTENGLQNEIVNGVVDEGHIWWAQAETVLGFYYTGKLTHDSSWIELAKKQWETVQRTVVDPREQGEWFWSTDKNGIPTDHAVVTEWKCPYHNSRMCLQIIEAEGL